uniref:Reverse transcriptase domain-containing protein n=1 Tax=Schistocephalus solidus TaxID=70667 RepID=A0A183TQM4_SCHSO
LRRILDFHHGYQQPTVVCFAEFAAVVDSIRVANAGTGVPAIIIAMIKATTRVLVHNKLSQLFDIRSSVRQGCIPSHITLNYVPDWSFRKTLHGFDDVRFEPGRRLTELDYADDIALLASGFGDLRSVILRVNESQLQSAYP